MKSVESTHQVQSNHILYKYSSITTTLWLEPYMHVTVWAFQSHQQACSTIARYPQVEQNPNVRFRNTPPNPLTTKSTTWQHTPTWHLERKSSRQYISLTFIESCFFLCSLCVFCDMFSSCVIQCSGIGIVLLHWFGVNSAQEHSAKYPLVSHFASSVWFRWVQIAHYLWLVPRSNSGGLVLVLAYICVGILIVEIFIQATAKHIDPKRTIGSQAEN